MAIIISITKKGAIIKEEVEETVDLIWFQLCWQRESMENIEPTNFNRDFVKLTNKTTKMPVIIQKRFINKIIESNE
jgi:hypothetical protein